jgi:DNA-binding HxlR family transcriptional regulator
MKTRAGKPKRRSDCPISCALDIVGDKWSLLIVRDIVLRGKASYGKFLKSAEHIATNILANRLALLEGAGIVKKTLNEEDKRKDIYALTTKGIDLLPMLLEMSIWSAKYDPKTGASREFISQARKDRERLIKQIKSDIKRGKFQFQE